MNPKHFFSLDYCQPFCNFQKGKVNPSLRARGRKNSSLSIFLDGIDFYFVFDGWLKFASLCFKNLISNGNHFAMPTNIFFTGSS